MHILSTMTTFNSIDILPYVIDYHKNEDIDLFILDNFSTDGTWEFIQDSKIPSKQVWTNNVFDLNLLLKYRCEIIHKIKPDWVIHTDHDMFLMTMHNLKKFIKNIESQFNIIGVPFIRLFDTGEEVTDKDPRKIFYYYCEDRDPLLKIHSYKNFIEYFADFPIMGTDCKIITTDSIFFLDYGNTRREKRKQEYKRIELAWKSGVLPNNFCEHFRSYNDVNYIWVKNELSDIRKSKYWELINYKFNLGGKNETRIKRI